MPLSTRASGSAPVTSASPPVLTSGNISEATARTCMGGRLEPRRRKRSRPRRSASWFEHPISREPLHTFRPDALEVQPVDHRLRHQANALLGDAEALGV